MGIDISKKGMPQFLEMDLHQISTSHTLRCDAKQSENRFLEYDKLFKNDEFIELGQFLNSTIIKGSQPKYIEEIGLSGIPVVNTLSIQNLKINVEDCRYISEEDFESLDSVKKIRKGDVLLTVDGGTSIGKAVVFDLDGDFTVDSHVAILRPSDISPITLVYLLASPIGQLQFNKAESGASGQTAVTEDDIRRFRFPVKNLDVLEKEAKKINEIRVKHEKEMEKLNVKLESAWSKFGENLMK